MVNEYCLTVLPVPLSALDLPLSAGPLAGAHKSDTRRFLARSVAVTTKIGMVVLACTPSGFQLDAHQQVVDVLQNWHVLHMVQSTGAMHRCNA